jgi:hypothetical protein
VRYENHATIVTCDEDATVGNFFDG